MSMTGWRLRGDTDKSAIIRIVDSTDGTPETGVTSATSGLDLKYRREGATAVSLTESDLGAVDSAHSDGGMIHIGAGYYRVDLPDAAWADATGVDEVLVFGTCTGMVVIGAQYQLVGWDPAAAAMTTSDITTAILAMIFAGSEDFQDFLRLARSVLYGKAAGLDGTTPSFRDAADSKDRITSTVSGGARTPTLDPT